MDPRQHLESVGCSFKVTGDYHCEESLEFVRSLNADLGIVYGTRILKPPLFSIPRLGSINIHKRKVPDYRGGGPVGLGTVAVAVGEDSGTLEDVYEPYLIQQGFLERTPRGRCATPLAYKRFGFTAPPRQASIFEG